MSIATQIIQGIYTVLPSAARTATQVILGKDIIDPTGASGINPEASGIVAYLNITAVPGIQTVHLHIDEQDPASLVWSNIAATVETAATGLVKLKLKQTIPEVAATQTLVKVQDTLPGIWRLRIIHSGAGSFTYSLGVVLYN